MTDIPRILFCGGRFYQDMSHVCRVFDYLESGPMGNRFLVIHGNAPGADTLCGVVGLKRGHPVIAMPAGWDYYGTGAGSLRNQWMLDFAKPTHAVAFPGGSGTLDMMQRVFAAKIPLYDVATGLHYG